MKKHWFLAVMLTMVMLLTGCECKHKEWNEATCLDPKTCAKCGATEGEALGHDWVDANCEEAQTCSRCGLTQGEPVGHCWKSATCEEPKTCEVCGKTEGEPVGHVWMDATCASPKTCAVCGKTEGSTTGHLWIDATCEAPKTCAVCGVTEGESLGHVWSQATLNMPAVCSQCGAIGGGLDYTYGGAGTVKWSAEGTIPMYATASADAEVIANIPSGTMLRCYLPNTPGWYCTTFNDLCGYIKSETMSDLVNENPTDTGHSNSNRAFDIKTIANAGIGSKVTFGEYTQNSEFITKKTSPLQWIVLDKTSDKVLLLAERSIECLPFNQTKIQVSWEGCTLRKWLNNEFLNLAFSTAEQRYILTSTITNPANPNGGGAGNPTTDKLFLLSYDDFFKYVHKTNYATTTITYFGLWHRKGISGIQSDWWLRTMGQDATTACEVGTNGYPVSNYCCNVNELRDVRPAMWVSLQ